MTQSPVVCEIDLEAPGSRAGVLRVPHSVHRSAYGTIPVPIAAVCGSVPGPTVLLLAGVHGDEYEGQAILAELIRTLDPADIRGRVLVLPMANFPAAQAGLRTSPLDGGNLNRLFPGDPRGGPTAILAHYIETALIAEADLVLDLHSGGTSMRCAPCAMTAGDGASPDRDLRDRVLAALGLPVALLHPSDAEAGYTSSAAARAGKVQFTLELGGGGWIDPEIRQGAADGLMRALAAAGVYAGAASATRLAEHCHILMRERYVYAEEDGICEILTRAGDSVGAGRLSARIHIPDRPERPPIEIHMPEAAVILAQRVPARVVPGDCLFHLGMPAEAWYQTD
jgi:predicted deacylase